MNKILLPLLLTLFLFHDSMVIYSQEVMATKHSTVDTITKGDQFVFALHEQNEEFVGEIIKGTSDSIWLKVHGEVIGYNIHEIKSLNKHNYDGKYQFMDRNSSRHILAPTAMNLDKGEAYYQNLLLLGSAFSYGFDDDFSITGAVFLPAIINEELFLYFAPKVSRQVDPKVRIGGGIIAVADLDAQDFDIYELAIVPFANATLGDQDNNITFGLGYGFEDDDLENRVFAAMFGGAFRLGERFVFATENTFARVNDSFPDNFYFGGHVLRIFKRKNTFEVGLLTLDLDDSLVPLPYFGYARAF